MAFLLQMIQFSADHLHILQVNFLRRRHRNALPFWYSEVIFIEIPVTFTQAALGSAIDVPTLEKPVRYDLPEGTQPGQVYRIKGQGVQMLNSTAKGDLYITVKVEVPRKLNDRQKELLRRFEESTTGREYEEKKSFFERVKDAFNN